MKNKTWTAKDLHDYWANHEFENSAEELAAMSGMTVEKVENTLDQVTFMRAPRRPPTPPTMPSAPIEAHETYGAQEWGYPLRMTDAERVEHYGFANSQERRAANKRDQDHYDSW